MGTTLPTVGESSRELPGYKGSRSEILLELKREPGLSIRDLMDRLRLSANAVRHHLKELEAEGLVEHARAPKGVGAPPHAYRLAPRAESLFPTGYARAITAMLDQVAAREGREAAVALLEQHLGEVAEEFAAARGIGDAGARMTRFAQIRTAEGYMAEGAAGPCCGTLVEHHCPIRAVAERFPEVCAVEARVIARALGGTVERKRHMLAGDSACEYKVSFAGGEAASKEEEGQ